jgi:hypothetical protein
MREAQYDDAPSAAERPCSRVGPDSYLLAQLGEGRPLTIRVDAASPIREGDGIAIRLPPEHLRVFDAAGNRVIRETS